MENNKIEILVPHPILGTQKSWIHKDEWERMKKYLNEQEKKIKPFIYYGK